MLQHRKQTMDSWKWVARKLLEERRIACIADEWYSDLMPSSVLKKKIKKNKKSWQRVDNSVQFIWRVFGNCSVFKCLNHGLSVKLNRYFSCRAGYMHLCNMKINLLKSPFLCLAYPPAVLISLVSPSDFMSSKWWRFPHSKYIANCWAIELPYQMEIKLGKIMVTKIEKKIIWSFTFYSKLKRNNRKGQQTKQHSCKD